MKINSMKQKYRINWRSPLSTLRTQNKAKQMYRLSHTP